MRKISDCAKEAIFFVKCLHGNVKEYNDLNDQELEILKEYMKNTSNKTFTIKNSDELIDFIFNHKTGGS